MPVLGKSVQILQSTKSRIYFWFILVFLVHVCADLYRVLAHACAWKVSIVTSKYEIKDLFLVYFGFPCTCVC